MNITKRMYIRIISFAAAVVIAGACFIIIAHNEITDLKKHISYGYSMNLSELDGSLYNISIALKKAQYASSATQFSTIAAELCSESTVAKNSMSQLPAQNSEFDSVGKFLSQVGDYTLYLSKKLIRGENISDEERENLHSMSQTASSLSESVGVVKNEYDKDGAWSGEFSSGIGMSVTSTFGDDLLELEELLNDYPSLVYDGPFSDHMLKSRAPMLENEPEISEEEAGKKAASALGTAPERLQMTESDGKLPAYVFSSDNASVSVTKRGGYIIYLRRYEPVSETKISYEEAVNKASEFLNGYMSGFTPTYYFADEGVCTVNFAYKDGVTLCYPDLVKIGVSLDTGKVVLIEAAGYISNHHTRSIPTPKYSSEQARAVLSESLTVNNVRRVMIPTDGKDEKHCYEFECTGVDGEELLVYVNVSNLEEEKILLLLRSDGGTLAK